MTPSVLVAVIAFCIAMIGLTLANQFFSMMIGEINRKREEGNLISYFGFTPPKVLRIFSEYRSFYPSGKLHLLSLAAFLVGMSGLLCVAVCFWINGW
jgi:hypothetical protein